MLLGEGWRAFLCVRCRRRRRVSTQRPPHPARFVRCALAASATGQGPACAVLRRGWPKDSNLQRCRVRPSEQLRAQALARRSSGHVSARVWSSIWSVLTSTRLQPPRLAKKLESPEAKLVSPSISEAHYPPWGAPLSTLRTPLGRWAVWLRRSVLYRTAAPAGSLPLALQRRRRRRDAIDASHTRPQHKLQLLTTLLNTPN